MDGNPTAAFIEVVILPSSAARRTLRTSRRVVVASDARRGDEEAFVQTWICRRQLARIQTNPPRVRASPALQSVDAASRRESDRTLGRVR